MDLSLSGNRQDGAHCRLQAQQDTRRSCSEGLLQEGNPARRSATAHDHPRWLCSIASCSTRDARGRPVAQTHETAIFQVPEQPHRAGPSRDQIQNPSHVGLQELRIRHHHHRWHRVASSYSQRPVHTRKSPTQRPNCACSMERGTRRLGAGTSHGYLRTSSLFAPEPRRGACLPQPVNWVRRSRR